MPDDWATCKRDGLAVHTRKAAWASLLLKGGLILAGAAVLRSAWSIFFVQPQPSNTSWCSSNLKQLSLAMVMYAEDYDGKLPTAWSGPAGLGKPGGWVKYAESDADADAARTAATGLLFAYTHSIGTEFHCPRDPRAGALSYAANARLFPTQVEPGKWAGVSRRAVALPDQVYLLVEADRQPDGLLHPARNWPAKRHFDGEPDSTIVAFLDGHVRRLRMDQLAPPTAPWNWNPTATGAQP
ncbi:MAG: hypothetical protein HZB16_10535 [Armatimonadetes bacterium]|nr:hypothetical protein [Armatimonadota bacterium]